MDRAAVHRELENARDEFHRLLAAATPADLRRLSDGTRWTNKQLLFHMLLGYLILRALTLLIRLFGRLPDSAGRTFARLLNAATRPFDAVNYLGSRLGGNTLSTRRHALPHPLGPVLPRPHDSRRPLPFPHPALPVPPTPTHPDITWTA